MRIELSRNRGSVKVELMLSREIGNTSFSARRWRDDARAQRQLMNVMMMAMLNKNGGGIVLNLDLLPAAL